MIDPLDEPPRTTTPTRGERIVAAIGTIAMILLLAAAVSYTYDHWSFLDSIYD